MVNSTGCLGIKPFFSVIWIFWGTMFNVLYAAADSEIRGAEDRAILVGDHKQLGPVVTEHNLCRAYLSMLERCVWFFWGVNLVDCLVVKIGVWTTIQERIQSRSLQGAMKNLRRWPATRPILERLAERKEQHTRLPSTMLQKQHFVSQKFTVADGILKRFVCLFATFIYGFSVIASRILAAVKRVSHVCFQHLWSFFHYFSGMTPVSCEIWVVHLNPVTGRWMSPSFSWFEIRSSVFHAEVSNAWFHLPFSIQAFLWQSTRECGELEIAPCKCFCLATAGPTRCMDWLWQSTPARSSDSSW